MPDAAARVQGLLTPAVRGWVPPPEPSAVEPDPLDPADGRRVAATPGPADAPGPYGAGLRAASVQPEGPDTPPPPSPAEPSALRLPAGLAQGRLDPGRRGAAALVVAALLAALVAAGVVLSGRPQETAVGGAAGVTAPEVLASGRPLPGAPAASEAAPDSTPTGDVVVAVAGKVHRPGLVRLPAGSRVDDAVRAAGGVLPGVDAGLLNLARKLVDGEQVLVGVDPPPGAVQPVVPGPGAPPAASAADPAGGPLDLNQATVGDLDALPGIGPVLAQRIVEWRTEHGRFASVEQLREVTGIGESKYADLEGKVTV